MTHAEILKNIKKRVAQPENWATKMSLATDKNKISVDINSPHANSYCLEGAIYVTVPKPENMSKGSQQYQDYLDTYKQCRKYIADAIDSSGGEYEGEGVHRNALINFNDDENTTHEHLLQILDKAIENAEKEI